MKILNLHHVQITIPPQMETAARQFYCDLLRLTEIEKPASLHGRGGFWLQIGHQAVHVGTESDVERTKTKAHIAYQVDDLNAWQQMLQANGFNITTSIPIPNYKRFEFRDPFGNRVELIQAIKIKTPPQ